MGVAGNPLRNPEVVRPFDQRIVNSYLSIIIGHWQGTMVCRAERMTTDRLAALIDDK